MFEKLLVSLGFVYCIITLVNGCVTPTGLGNNCNEIDPNTLAVPEDGIFLSNIMAIIPHLSEYEAPIQFRLIQMANIAIFNSMAAFEEKSLDHFARIDESEYRRRCFSNSKDFNLHRRVTLAYTLYFSLTTFVPESQGERLISLLLLLGSTMSPMCTHSHCFRIKTLCNYIKK